MRFKFLHSIIFVLAFCLCAVFCFASETDFQYRGMFMTSPKINDSWKGSLFTEIFTRNDARQLYNYYFDIGAFYTGFAKWLDVGAFYRHLRSKSNIGWLTEYRPHADAVLKWAMGEYKLSNRGRIAYRIREKEDDVWRFRNILTLTFPYKWTKLDLQPFIAHEIFYTLDTGDLETNETRAGFNFKLCKYMTANIYYMYHLTKYDSLHKEIHYLGSVINFYF